MPLAGYLQENCEFESDRDVDDWSVHPAMEVTRNVNGSNAVRILAIPSRDRAIEPIMPIASSFLTARYRVFADHRIFNRDRRRMRTLILYLSYRDIPKLEVFGILPYGHRDSEALDLVRLEHSTDSVHFSKRQNQVRLYAI